MITLAQTLKLLKNNDYIYLRLINGGLWDFYNFSTNNLKKLLDLQKIKVYYIQQHFNFDESSGCELELTVNLSKDSLQALYWKTQTK